MSGELLPINIMEICALVIAVCALVISLWQGWISKNHAMLSVEPYLDINSFTDEELLSGRLELANNGIGPALIKKITLYFLGNIITSIDLSENAADRKLIESFKPYALDEKVTILFSHGSFHLMAGRSINFFKLHDISAAEEVVKFEQYLAGIKIRIDYESMYKVKKVATWN